MGSVRSEQASGLSYVLAILLLPQHSFLHPKKEKECFELEDLLSFSFMEGMIPL